MRDLFSPEKRKAIYSFVSVAVPAALALAVTMGWVSTGSIDTFAATLALVAGLMNTFAQLLARANVNQ